MFFSGLTVGVIIGIFIGVGAAVGAARKNTKVGTPSASHNTGSPKLPARCELCELYHICHFGMVIGNDKCKKARSQLRAGA